MNISRFFIDRPIFAAVLSLLIFIGGAISVNTGVAVPGRASVSAAQPDGVPPVVTSLRYPADPTWTTLAIPRIGDAALSVASITLSISLGIA